MPATGIGASVARMEDERFLRGRGQYVGDFPIPRVREVAFVIHLRQRGSEAAIGHGCRRADRGSRGGLKSVQRWGR